MGMYTEICYNACLKEDAPKEVIDTLNHLLNKEPIDKLPNHKFFSCTRWKTIGWGSSYYFEAQPHRLFEFDPIRNCCVVNLICNLKNYNNEIENFIDWLDPYIDGSEGHYLGYTRYEEDNDPTPIRKK